MLSVIIPIFNTGKYLDQCIASVVKQSYQDLDIILVDDCSSDKKTIDIINKWVDRDSRIRLIDKKVNEGVDKARFDGIKASQGEYLAFADSNDWMPLDALESMMLKVLETGADIVKGNSVNIRLGGLQKKVSQVDSLLAEREILHDELMDKYYLSFFGKNIIHVALWGTIFRRSLFIDANIQPTGLRFGEDLIMNMKIFPFVRKFYQMEKVVYCYRQGLPVMSSKYLDTWLSNFNSLYKIKMQQIEDFGYDKAVFYQNVELINYLSSFVLGCALYRKERIQECVSELKRELQDPIYRNLTALMTNDKWAKKAMMIEQADAPSFWKYVIAEQKQGMTLRMKVVESCASLYSYFRK